ncbi:MAG: IS1595 family transposase [Firmicutes bacterium]|nr:IS1595 family transposase [Bacillota bacterium]
MLCSDSWRSYRSFARQRGLKHIRLNMSRGQRVVQGVNSYHSRLKTWIRRFNGVATKYLLNYLVWHEYLDESRRLHYTLNAQELFSTALSTMLLLRAA